MSTKLRIRIGEVEIDYEGTEDFLKQELPQLLKTAMELHKAAGPSTKSAGGGNNGKNKLPILTTGSIAAKLKAASGMDLLLAAAAQLTLIAKKDTFSRQELLAEMQNASSYYKKSYSGNLTKYLKSALTEQKLTETAKNVYALSAKTRSELEGKLANT
ncbi:MAG: hypothetical protein ACYSR5_12590 [Planctomycetota bacterium]